MNIKILKSTDYYWKGYKMAKCPKCKTEVKEPAKTWKYGVFKVKMYKCKCGNQFREYFKGDKLSFVLSAHDGGLGPRMKPKNS